MRAPLVLAPRLVHRVLAWTRRRQSRAGALEREWWLGSGGRVGGLAGVCVCVYVCMCVSGPHVRCACPLAVLTKDSNG